YGVILSLDTEYQECQVDGGRVAVNDILSYQYTAVFLGEQENYQLVENVLMVPSPLRVDRLTYAHILADALGRFKIGWRKARGMRVLIVSHFGAAEWAAMRNRVEVAQYLEPVDNCPVTFRPMPVSWTDAQKHRVTVQVDGRDTALLSPGRRASLRHLA